MKKRKFEKSFLLFKKNEQCYMPLMVQQTHMCFLSLLVSLLWEIQSVLGCSIKKKKIMEECWQPIFVNKLKHDLKNTSCGWFTWNSLSADLGQDLTVGHPAGIHQPCTASDIRKILPKALRCCFWSAVTKGLVLCYRLCSKSRWGSLRRAPETSGSQWWRPHGSFLVGAGWSWASHHWVSPVFPSWTLRPREGSLAQLSCTGLRKADTE